MSNQMLALLPLLAEMNRLLYAPPIIIGVSLVYAATRHEDMKSILAHARSFGIWTVIFMVIVGVVLETLAFLQ